MGLISTLIHCDDDGESKCVNDGDNDGGNDDNENDGHQYRQD